MDFEAVRPWLTSLVVLAAAGLLGPLVTHWLVRRLEAICSRTPTEIDDLALAAVRWHLPLWVFLAGLAVASRLAPVSDRAALVAERAAVVLFLLSLSFAAANLLTGLLARTSARAGGAAATTSLIQNTVRVLVVVLGGLLILSNLGVSITPLLTALGVGSLAVALALQPTLSNLFAGLHLTLTKPIRVGDFVALEGGVKGYVEDITWRATSIRELPNDIVAVPNARIAEMVLTNYSLPDPEQAILVQVGVAYGSDLDRVEKVTCEVARAVLSEVPGGIAGFDPFIRYHTLSDSSIDFTVILRGGHVTDQYLITHEFIKRLARRYQEEGIEIPFPQRVVHLPAGLPPAGAAASTSAGAPAGPGRGREGPRA